MSRLLTSGSSAISFGTLLSSLSTRQMAAAHEVISVLDGHVVDEPLTDKQIKRTSALTLTQHIVAECGASELQLALLFNNIQNGCKVIAHSIQEAGIAGTLGMAGGQNFTGDEVKKLDIISNEIFVHSLKSSGVCSVLVSEENDEPILVKESMSGPYCVAFDPLDGSSNIDCNVSVGTIFAVYKRRTTEGVGEVADILRPGTDIIAAGYAMYGGACELVITWGNGVRRYALDPAIGEFILLGNVEFPKDGGKKIYSCNEGNSLYWDDAIKQYTSLVKDQGYTARYVGSMVADIHRTLLYGGIFYYPADKKSKKGKLRVLYEGFPMAMITEQAGGVASTGMFEGKIQRVLDVVPDNIHARCPIIMGCKRDVEALLALYSK
mmetsp:Transcript_35117/g.91940  ORF Transcript_35117/g.91940 Transcript_35117/m.91940 type:complete len:379 (-) Transcript_35117:241-1377(-)